MITISGVPIGDFLARFFVAHVPIFQSWGSSGATPKNVDLMALMLCRESMTLVGTYWRRVAMHPMMPRVTWWHETKHLQDIFKWLCPGNITFFSESHLIFPVKLRI